MDPSTSTVPTETTFVPTTDDIAEILPRFRLLIVGRPGVGKTSLINAIFKTRLDVRHFGAGTANINKGITSHYNEHLIIHDSEGYEPGDERGFRVLERFVTERSQKAAISERLHAIWLCITSPYFLGVPIVQAWDEKILELNQCKVPIIVVYTKFDLFMANNLRMRGSESSTAKGDDSLYFYGKYAQMFMNYTENIDDMPCTLASKYLPDTLLRLVEITRKSIRAESTSVSSGLSPEPVVWDLSDAIQLTFDMAQCHDMSAKLDASIRVGNKKYWRAITSGTHFLNATLKQCFSVIHRDLITIWNINDVEEHFLSDEFRDRMAIIVGDPGPQNAGGTNKIRAPTSSPDLHGLKGIVYKFLPEHIHFLMAYVVDLTIILKAVFQVALENQAERKVTQEHVTNILYEFYLSEKRKHIHDGIAVTTNQVWGNGVASYILSLIVESETMANDRPKRPSLSSLLSILKFEQSATNQVMNKVTPDILCAVLDTGYEAIINELQDPSIDADLMIDFVSHAIRTEAFSIPDYEAKASWLIVQLIFRGDLPGSFFLTDVRKEVAISSEAVGMRSPGRVFKGYHRGRLVALKILRRSRGKDLFRKDYCQEARVWRLLSHPFILPLLGVFEEKPELFLVSPLMANGTLAQWRKDQMPSVNDIQTRVIHIVQLQCYDSVGAATAYDVSTDTA